MGKTWILDAEVKPFQTTRGQRFLKIGIKTDAASGYYISLQTDGVYGYYISKLLT
jgi:hypothetical protein